MTAKLTHSATIRPLELLDRIFDESSLTQAVAALPAAALVELIDHVGLEDCAELVALTSTRQLREILDADLWRATAPGVDESFQAERVALWLNAMVDAGDAFVAKKLSELPEEIVTLALHQSVLVIDIDLLALEMVDRHREVDLIEKALESCLYQELGQYRVIARDEAGWHAVLEAILALDQHQHELLQRILERCCDASTELIEESGGLYEVLSSAEMLESDAAAERQDRRAQRGFVAPSDAKSFLGLARQTRLAEIVEARRRDPITAAYFREKAPAANAASASRGAPSAGSGVASSGETSALASRQTLVGELLSLLREAGVYRERKPPRPLTAGDHHEATGRLRGALEQLMDEGLEIYGQRVEELAYLANIVVVGCSHEGARFELEAAMDAALALCELGLEYLLARQIVLDAEDQARPSAVAMLRMTGADKLFRIGWHLLHRDGPTAEARNWHDVPLEAKGALDAALSTARAFF